MFIPIKAAGKTLSQKNLEGLKAAIKTLMEVMISSGQITREELFLMEKTPDNQEMINASLASDFKFQQWRNRFVEATRLFINTFLKKPSLSLVTDYIQELQTLQGSFDDVKGKDLYAWELTYDAYPMPPSYMPYNEWGGAKVEEDSLSFSDKVNHLVNQQNIRQLMSHFIETVACAVNVGDDAFADKYGEKTRREVFANAIAELESLLKGLVGEQSSPIQSQAEPEKAQPPPLKASEPIIIACSSLITAKKKGTTQHPNLWGIKGVLFTANRVTDAAPVAGTNGYPMYIPLAAATAAIEDLDGSSIPLNISADLSEHRMADIAGSATRIQLKGNECHIEGELWPINRGDLTQILSGAKDIDLGMSLEAIPIESEITTINGKTVYQLNKFHLTGGTILERDKAADRSTTLIAASSSPSGEGNTPPPVNSSSTNQATEAGGTPMDKSEQILAAIDKFSETVQGLNTQLQTVQETVQVLQEAPLSRL